MLTKVPVVACLFLDAPRACYDFVRLLADGFDLCQCGKCHHAGVYANTHGEFLERSKSDAHTVCPEIQ
jgi:hypothetical protein